VAPPDAAVLPNVKARPGDGFVSAAADAADVADATPNVNPLDVESCFCSVDRKEKDGPVLFFKGLMALFVIEVEVLKSLADLGGCLFVMSVMCFS